MQGAGASWGVCLDKLCSGHFIAEAEADSEVNCGLALVQERTGSLIMTIMSPSVYAWKTVIP